MLSLQRRVEMIKIKREAVISFKVDFIIVILCFVSVLVIRSNTSVFDQ